MRKIAYFFISILLVSAMQPLISAPTAAQAIITLEGTISCSEWRKARQDKLSTRYEHFLLGLLNGLSYGSNVDFWRAKVTKPDRDAVYYWMDNYCAGNPLSGIYVGAFKLMNEQTSDAFDKAMKSRWNDE